MVDEVNKEIWFYPTKNSEIVRIPINAGIAGHVATTGESLNIKDAY